jgi:hypothetical protein
MSKETPDSSLDREEPTSASFCPSMSSETPTKPEVNQDINLLRFLLKTKVAFRSLPSPETLSARYEAQVSRKNFREAISVAKLLELRAELEWMISEEGATSNHSGESLVNSVNHSLNSMSEQMAGIYPSEEQSLTAIKSAILEFQEAERH